ncbi:MULTISPECIES: spermidine/putrescine ABC transporter substrate-binding protein PotF [Rahnella]|jgi:putrescine transport system substrate-binding protein|uniref:Putrescine-binding periplasmic protein n=1 Tax=Rahnella sp. (strain Y9602) TaxID=2703885 RepID=A0A0H3FB59_RAHSY|nr:MULTISPECIES: spermidine/putrescine ABC transporter substrate-binding protein PotF [Rahnella]AFE58759.1 putrescine transporter subunit: periplasmic-binding component of ABC superfamily [Rahnella aquatilis HX2]AYA07398.1 spermidine/putrescine ABC transporter substrate-binding protein PotF [Rahnella aquatilis]ADW74114.1 extracellular solute-binding protein family 1 [Rahnella aceris]AZP42602.1 spermidine/putrescine ABC transporter substrate-binding protein PotF [Rahnella aquatilis]AZP46942.1 s
MFTLRKKWLSGVVAGLVMAASVTASADEKTLHIYNWSDYIAPNTVPDFQKETGIKVVYDVFDSNEVLEGKLMAGSTGFDLVVPSASFLERQLAAGVFQPLDKSKLPNYKNMDPELLKMVAQHDPGNKYAIPYLWATTGIGYNVDKVKAVLGKDAPVDSWDLVLKPENLEKLKSCGVSFLDAPAEIYATVLNYLHLDPNSTKASDYTGAANDLLLKLRPNIRYFHSSQYINDLANGDICVAIGWAGDVMQAGNRAKEAKNGVNVAYSIPKEGALAFFDVFAIPADAKNLDEAYQFLNYLMEPKVIAQISNTVYYASGNKAATPLVNEDVRNNPGIYPPADVQAKLFTLKVQDPKIDRVITRSWTKVKTGK